MRPNERRQLAFLSAMNALTSILDIAALAVLVLIVGLYTKGADQMPSWMPPWIRTHTITPVLLFLLFFGLKNLFAYTIYSRQTFWVHRIAARLSERQLTDYLNGSYVDYVTTDSARLLHRINHEPIEFANYILAGIQQLFTEFVLIFVAILAILWYNAALFGLLVLFLLPPIALVGWLTKKRLRTARRQVKEDAGKATQYLQEALNSYVESNIYDRKDFFAGRQQQYQRRLGGHLSQLQIAQWVPARIVELFAVAGLFILILLHRSGNSVDIITIGAFMAAAYKIIPGIVRISNLTAQMRTYEYTIADLKPAPLNEIEPKDLPAINSIQFDQVSFSHPCNSILNQFNLRIEPGDFVDLVAPSGKGKTTVLHLLLGFLQPDSGKILINGEPADTALLANYRRQIAYVKQQTFLIHDTIEQNITLSEEETNATLLHTAINASGLHSWVDTFPEKTEKIITDSGKNLSGGQRKRIAVARALYKNADIIILDEPFSELDEASERGLLQYFKELAQQGKIVILITHNRISAGYCNKTIVLHE